MNKASIKTYYSATVWQEEKGRVGINICLFLIFLFHENRGPSVRSLIFIDNMITKQNFLLMQTEVYNGNLFPDRELKDLPRLWMKSVVPRTETSMKNITRTHQVL